MRHSIRHAASIAVITGLYALDASGSAFVFNKVVDTSEGYSSFTLPAINSSGTVSFTATLNGFAQVFEASQGGTAASIFTPAPPANGTLQFLGGTAINDAGQVAFGVTIFPGSILYRASAGGVAVVSTPAITPGGGYLVGAIANDGTIYYQGSEDFPSAVRSSKGTVVYQFSKDHAMTRPAVAANDGIATSLDYSNGVGGSPNVADVERNGVSLGGPFTTAGDTVDPPRYLVQASAPDMNSAGDIYFAGGFGDINLMNFSATSSLTYVGTGALTGTPGAPAVNDAGTLVDLDSTGHLATGVGEVNTRVISVGDALDGSTVTALSFEHDGLSESNLVAFEATLADGRTGIYTVAVPEPATLGALGVGAIALMRRRSRRT